MTIPQTAHDLTSTIVLHTFIKKYVCIIYCTKKFKKGSLLKMAVRNTHLLILGTNKQMKKLTTLRVFID